jgi:5-methylthioadenosine/S-adenosylhomocysteine deaminase
VSEVGVVRGGHLLTVGPAGDLEDGAVAFADGEVRAVGPFAEIAGRFPEALVVGDDRGDAAGAGQRAHAPVGGSAVRDGRGPEPAGVAGRDHYPGRAAPDPGDGPVGAMLKGAELLLSGVTCVNDMFCHTNQGSLASLGAVDGLEAMGLRGVVAFGARTPSTPSRWRTCWPSTTP